MSVLFNAKSQKLLIGTGTPNLSLGNIEDVVPFASSKLFPDFIRANNTPATSGLRNPFVDTSSGKKPMALAAAIAGGVALATGIASSAQAGVSNAQNAAVTKYNTDVGAAVSREGFQNQISLQKLQAGLATSLQNNQQTFSNEQLNQRVKAQQDYLAAAYQQSNSAWRAQYDATIGKQLTSARSYNIPDYMTLRGQVPLVNRQLAGNNFFTAPPGVSPITPIFND